MPKTLMKLAGASAVAALMTAPALAQEDISGWDADQNQTITGEEFGTGFGETGIFGEWDQDDDEVLSEEEFGQGTEGISAEGGEDWANADMAEWDQDASGDLNQEEFQQGVFTQYDEDQSGDWNQEEQGLFQDDAGEEGFWDW